MKETILKLLGFFTKKNAIENGFDKYGSYYGIPIWIKSGDMTIVEKNIFLYPFTWFFTKVELFVNLFKDEDFDDDAGFLFTIKGDIDGN